MSKPEEDLEDVKDEKKRKKEKTTVQTKVRISCNIRKTPTMPLQIALLVLNLTAVAFVMLAMLSIKLKVTSYFVLG